MKCFLTHNMQYKGYHGNLFYEMCSYSQYAIQRIPWYLILYHASHEKCPYNIQYKGYHGNLFYTIT